MLFAGMIRAAIRMGAGRVLPKTKHVAVIKRHVQGATHARIVVTVILIIVASAHNVFFVRWSMVHMIVQPVCRKKRG